MEVGQALGHIFLAFRAIFRQKSMWEAVFGVSTEIKNKTDAPAQALPTKITCKLLNIIVWYLV
jgi:hypothetical protein